MEFCECGILPRIVYTKMLTLCVDLIEDLDFHLIVHHPYKALLQMCGKDSAKLPGMLDIDDATFQMAW